MTNPPAPITDAQARAVEAGAKATERAIGVLEGLGGYLREVLGTVPHDLVGYLGGDQLKIRRAENLRDIIERSREKLAKRNAVSGDPASVSITLPLMVAAADESRDELKEIWAGLLATAADPANTLRFRNVFIEIAKSLDPLDAIFLRKILTTKPPTHPTGGFVDTPAFHALLVEDVGASKDELNISIDHLHALSLIRRGDAITSHQLTSLGREFLRAVIDEWPKSLQRK